MVSVDRNCKEKMEENKTTLIPMRVRGNLLLRQMEMDQEQDRERESERE